MLSCVNCHRREQKHATQQLCHPCYEMLRAKGHLNRERGEYGKGYYRRGYKILCGGKPEHRAVAEKMYGGPLPPGTIVHHINGIKDDNRPENLQIMTRAEHAAHHEAEKRRIRCAKS